MGGFMIKIMIADDEKVAIDALKYIIEKNFSNVEVISSVRTGREAILQMEENLPDIIFMDIRMPGINGLEAIREIRSSHKKVIIFVLTAFDQFEFAKEALQLGVMEYLLKPVKRTKVVEVLSKAIESINAEKEKWKTELELKEKIEYMGPIVEAGFIYSILMVDENKKELTDYKRIFDNIAEDGYILTLQFMKGKTNDEITSGLRSHDFYDYFADLAKCENNCIVGPIMMNRIITFVPVRKSKNENIVKKNAVSLGENLFKKISEKYGVGVKIGIGTPYNSFEDLKKSFEESVMAIRHLEQEGVIHFSDIDYKNNFTNEYPIDKEKIFFKKISAGNTAESIIAFNYIFDWLMNEYEGKTLKIKCKILELLFIAKYISVNEAVQESHLKNNLLEEILSIEETRELQLWCRKLIENLAEQAFTSKDFKTGSLIRKAKDYIKFNYAKNITLEDVAMEINVSPQYLSKLFKEETRENFIDYLTAIRMKIAKDLLEKNDLSIKEICFHIGYSDPNYFSRIFKKNIGITPTEYKEELINSKFE